jgi:hypothetical protein
MKLARDETAPAPISPKNKDNLGLIGPVSSHWLLQCEHGEEARMTRRRELLETSPSLNDDINEVIDWAIYGNTTKLQELNLAWRAYEAVLKDLSGNDRAALHVICACIFFWEECRPTLTAVAVRDKAIELWEQAEKLIRRTPFEDKRHSIKWPRLFGQLGIQLRFSRIVGDRK